MKPIKTAIVGFGLSGEFFHAPIIHAVEEFELTAVLSSQEEKVHHELIVVLSRRQYAELELKFRPQCLQQPYAWYCCQLTESQHLQLQ